MATLDAFPSNASLPSTQIFFFFENLFVSTQFSVSLCTYRELAQPIRRLKEAHIKRPRPRPMVLTMGTTVILPKGKQKECKTSCVTSC